MERLYCIINLSSLSDPHWFAGGSRHGCRMDKEHGPTAFYEDRKQAEDELFRLHGKGLDQCAIFELVGYVVESPVTVMAAHIEAPENNEPDDGIPF
jgi:hypothetical protein